MIEPGRNRENPVTESFYRDRENARLRRAVSELSEIVRTPADHPAIDQGTGVGITRDEFAKG